MALFCECRRTTEVALTSRFIQTLTKHSIAVQNMRGQGYYSAAKEYDGSKDLVDSKDRKHISLVFFIALVSLVLFCYRKVEVRITIHHLEPGTLLQQ